MSRTDATTRDDANPAGPSLPFPPLSRRAFFHAGGGALVLLAGTRAGAQAPPFPKRPPPPSHRPLVTVGLVTDVHYADAPTAGTRHYRESLGKMREAVDAFNRERVRTLIGLGDLIDARGQPDAVTERGFLRTIVGETARAQARRHFVLGNHCVTGLSKPEFLDGVGQARSYYSFDRRGVHFVILDACFRADGQPYAPGKFVWSDTDIPAEEREWLEADLKATRLPTLVFLHQRLDRRVGDVFTVRSAPAVRRLLEASGKVLAVFQGHSHRNELREIGGIPYLTLAAMVEGSGAENSGYSVLRVYRDGSLSLSGFRRHAFHPGTRPGALRGRRPLCAAPHLLSPPAPPPL